MVMVRGRGRVSFAGSRRAICLDYDKPVEEEEMPMVGRVRVDRTIKDLVDALIEDGAVVEEGSNRRLKVTFEGKSTFISPVCQGKRHRDDIVKSLAQIGMHAPRDSITARDEQTGETFSIEGISIGDPGKAPVMEGIQWSPRTETMFSGLMACIFADVNEHVVAKLAEASLDSDGRQWQQIAEEHEAQLVKLKEERDRAVHEVVAQRDEARAKVKELEVELTNIRTGLKLLGIALPEKVNG